MSDGINCYSTRLVKDAGTKTVIADQYSSQPINEFAIQIGGMRSMLINTMDRLFEVDRSQYSLDVLAELSALVPLHGDYDSLVRGSFGTVLG
jgi:hypothetical protein